MSQFTSFSLTLAHGTHLWRALRRYRASLLVSVLPSPGRNTTLRVLQRLEGGLLHELDQQPLLLTCVWSQEEQTILRTLLVTVVPWYMQERITPERNAALADLATLHIALDRQQLTGGSGSRRDP